MRASLFRRRPVQLTRLNQRFIPSAAAGVNYTLTVTTLNVPITFNAVNLVLFPTYNLPVSVLNVPVTFNAITLSWLQGYILPIDVMNVPITRNNVNLVWVGAPVVLAKNPKFAMAMKIGF
jgi:hypothetical protein